MKEKVTKVKTIDGFKLQTIACMPKNPKKIVVMCHGINSHKQEYLDMFPNLAMKLFDKNVGSVRFDFRGHGESSGKDLDFDLISQLIDLDTIIRWTRKKWSLDKSIKFSFVGVSFGSAPGVIYHSVNQTFQEISLFAPVISYYNTFRNPTTEWGKNNFNANAWEIAREVGYLLIDEEFKVSLRLLTEFSFIEPVEKIGELNVSVQLFHGTKDNLVPYQVAERLVGKYPSVDVRIIPNMGHGLYLDGDDEGVTAGSIELQNDYYSSTVKFLTSGIV